MDGPRDYHTNQNKLETNTIWYHLYVESKKKKKIQMNLFTKQKDAQI